MSPLTLKKSRASKGSVSKVSLDRRRQERMCSGDALATPHFAQTGKTLLPWLKEQRLRPSWRRLNLDFLWTLENHKSINIHTDSQSSIETLRSTRPRSAFVISVKKNFYLAGDLVGLDWVQAHVGDPDNELSDRLAKLAREKN
ncbi:hypothetical protein AVEN_234218-1 [Araneus ventricosus]|uniref:Uncharacterized protein n=1 Tax=Araneus ventricosus TaxID=182803 RepID=A0A4Y2A852_ARAVE|nr:hypothetical protein AVEN_234218-1 [Araneus ventricosus]